MRVKAKRAPGPGRAAWEVYGKRVTKADRRIMLALLSGASNLSSFTVMRVAQTGGGTSLTLARLTGIGWTSRRRGPVRDPEGEPGMVYELTQEGRSRVGELLGLTL